MGRTVDIEVRLDGAEEAKKGFKGIGETASSMAERFDKSNSHMGEGLGSLVGNIEEAGGAFKDLTHTIDSMSKGGKASIISLLPAIGGLVAVGFALYETFINISGAAHEADQAEDALATTSADLQSKLEMLAEKGVKPTNKELRKFTRLTLSAQLSKEKLEKASKAVARSMAKEEKIMTEKSEKYSRRREEGFTKALDNLLTGIGYYKTQLELMRELDAQRIESDKLIRRQTLAQADTQEKLYRAETEFLNLESRAPVEIARRLTENIVILKSLELREAEVAQVSELERQKYKLELEGQHLRLQSRFKESEKLAILGDRDKTQLVELYKEVQQSIDAINAETLDSDVIDKRFSDLEAKAKADRDKAEKARAAAAKARRSAALAAQKAAEAKRLMLERQTQNELFAIRALEIQKMKQLGFTKLEVLDAQHELERDRARDNQNQLLMADMRFEMAKTELLKSEEAKRQAERDKRQAEILKQIDERTQREQAYIDQAGEIADAFGGAFAEASFGALAMGESFKESISQIIFGLGKQAAVESLISTAKMFSSLAMGDLIGAANNLKAATGFAAGAVAAGVAGSALAGGGGGGGGSASPSGAPQIAPTPDRESAQETSTVFNINFGGAVIYDTKQAAERAMVDRLVGVMNQRNRGARRLNLGRS